jgi:hypothetical protein
MINRALQPKILETKEELLTALKNGQLKTSKYNLLGPNEKLFVELVCFGGYTGEQAVKCINPSVKNATAIANRMLSNPAVADTLEELSIAKDKKFMAEVSSARDMALAKLKFIMSTTNDQALAASCAKVILDKAEAVMKSHDKKEEQVGGVKFNIQVENVYTGNGTPINSEPVIIPLDDDMEESVIIEKKALEKQLDAQILAKNERLKKINKRLGEEQVNPATGLPYVIAYEGVDNYNDPDNLPAKAREGLKSNEEEDEWL